MGGEGEGSGVKGGGKWGLGTPLSTPSNMELALTLKAPITTAANGKFCNIFPNFRKK